MRARDLILLALAILPGCAERAEVRKADRVAKKAARAGYAPPAMGEGLRADPPKLADRRAGLGWGEWGDPGSSVTR